MATMAQLTRWGFRRAAAGTEYPDLKDLGPALFWCGLGAGVGPRNSSWGEKWEGQTQWHCDNDKLGDRANGGPGPD